MYSYGERRGPGKNKNINRREGARDDLNYIKLEAIL